MPRRGSQNGEEEKPKSTVMGQREAMDVGRLLGFLKRRDPELYEQIMQESELSGQKPTDLIYESLTFRYLSMRAQVAKLNAAELMAAFEFWYQLNKLLISQQMQMLKWFFTEGLKSYGEMIDLVESKMPPPEPATPPPPPQQPPQPKLEVPSQMREALLNMMANTMMSAIATIQNAMLAMTGQKPQPIQMPQQEQAKVKVIEKKKKEEKPQPKVKVVEDAKVVTVGQDRVAEKGDRRGVEKGGA